MSVSYLTKPQDFLIVKMSFQRILSTIVLAVSSLSLPSGFAQSPSESIEYQMEVQRACEAAIWAMPAVSEAFRE